MHTTWLIYSREHNAWWNPGGHGYTTEISAAGRFPTERAEEIVENANMHLKPGSPPNEFKMLAPECVEIPKEIMSPLEVAEERKLEIGRFLKLQMMPPGWASSSCWLILQRMERNPAA